MSRARATSPRHTWRWLRAAPLLVACACGGPQELLGPGGKCFRDDECEPGLVCVAPMEGDINRVCTDDPTPLISNVEGPPVVEPMAGTGGVAGAAGAMAGGGMGAVAAGGMGATAGGGSGGAGATAGTDTGGSAGSGGTDTAGTGGNAGSAGSAGSAGTGGSGGTEPEGGAPS